MKGGRGRGAGVEDLLGGHVQGLAERVVLSFVVGGRGVGRWEVERKRDE